MKHLCIFFQWPRIFLTPGGIALEQIDNHLECLYPPYTIALPDRRCSMILSLFHPEYFFVPVFSRAEIRRVIVSRLRAIKTIKPLDLFSTKALELIADYSLGIPRIALMLATNCLDQLIADNTDRVTVHIAKKVVMSSGFGLATDIVGSIVEKDEETFITDVVSLLTPKRWDIIANVFGHQLREKYFFPPMETTGLRSSDLAELFGVNLSTMNYHLKPLTTTQPVPLLRTKDDLTDARSKIFYVDWDSAITMALETVVVYNNLLQKKYRIETANILVSQRGEKALRI